MEFQLLPVFYEFQLFREAERFNGKRAEFRILFILPEIKQMFLILHYEYYMLEIPLGP